MIMADINPDELIRFFDAIDSVAKFRFAAPYNDLNQSDRIEVLLILERGYTAGFLSWPDERHAVDEPQFDLGDPNAGC
jgi:hypothetical protein